MERKIDHTEKKMKYHYIKSSWYQICQRQWIEAELILKTFLRLWEDVYNTVFNFNFIVTSWENRQNGNGNVEQLFLAENHFIIQYHLVLFQLICGAVYSLTAFLKWLNYSENQVNIIAV